jgi:hypothetical protein
MKKFESKFILVVAFLFVLVLIPATKSEAEVLNAGAKISLYAESEESLYAGGAVTGLTQTGIQNSSVTISWNAAAGAIGYLIYGYSSTTDSLYYITQATTSTAVLPGSNIVDQHIIVVPYDAEDENHIAGYEKCATIVVSTLPKKVTGIKYYNSFQNSNKLSVTWTGVPCRGFEAICYNKSGKVVQTVDTTSSCGAEFSKTNTQNIYSVVVKSYVVINGNQKKYGPTSAKFYAVPQPKITSTNSDVKIGSVKLKWKKVKGAKNYTIYVSKKSSGGFKKVATVKASKAASYTVKKCGKASLNTLNTKYYFKIVTTAKYGKKSKKSQSKAQISASSVYR